MFGPANLGRIVPPQTVASLLAQQPEESLAEMLDSTNQEIERLNVEISRLRVEAHLVEQALARHRPRNHGGSDGRRSVRQAEVVEVAVDLPARFTGRDVRRRFQELGTEISGAAVRNHLRRLVRDGVLEGAGEGVYKFTPPAQPPTPQSDDDADFPASDADIPF